GAKLLVKSVDQIANDTVVRRAQTGEVTRAPKLTKELGRINWENSNREIKNLVRGLNPYPGAYSYLNGRLIKIFRVRLADDSRSAKPGEIVDVSEKDGLLEVGTGSGNLIILELQPEGKRRMIASEYLHGYKVQKGLKFA
ncbi:MAG: methionyl-tRNA formyltransferase, partial [bacterium]